MMNNKNNKSRLGSSFSAQTIEDRELTTHRNYCGVKDKYMVNFEVNMLNFKTWWQCKVFSALRVCSWLLKHC